MERRGSVWCGSQGRASQGTASCGSHGLVGPHHLKNGDVTVWFGQVWFGKAVKVRRGLARYGQVWQSRSGLVRFGRVRQSRSGPVRPVTLRSGRQTVRVRLQSKG